MLALCVTDARDAVAGNDGLRREFIHRRGASRSRRSRPTHRSGSHGARTGGATTFRGRRGAAAAPRWSTPAFRPENQPTHLTGVRQALDAVLRFTALTAWR